MLGKPLIWGPIGHHPSVPAKYLLKEYGIKALVKDRTFSFIKNTMRRLDPFIYICLWKADYILAINSAVALQYPWVKKKIVLLPAIGGVASQQQPIDSSDIFNVFSAGRLEPIKGFDVALHAYNEFCSKLTEEERTHVTFQIAGSGTSQSILSSIAKKNVRPESIQFLSWVSKEEINKLYASASVFLFPSHEGAGMVIPEALAFGLPIICFNNEGPGESTDEHCALKIEYGQYEQSVQECSEQLMKLYKDTSLRANMSDAALMRFSEVFDWNKKGIVLNQLYYQLVISHEEKHCIYTPAQ
jgi:glycosyltransferase involved in cell wall biosynthesis